MYTQYDNGVFLKKDNLMARTLFALCLAVMFTLPAQAQGPSPEDRITQWAKDWAALYAARELDALMALYHPDAMLFSNNQPAAVGVDAIRAFFAQSFERSSAATIDFKIEDISVFGDAARLVSLYKMKIYVGKNTPITVVGRSMLMYQRAENGRWLLFADMDNTAPDATLETFAAAP